MNLELKLKLVTTSPGGWWVGGWVGGWLGGGLTKKKLMLFSTRVEVAVELGKKHTHYFILSIKIYLNGQVKPNFLISFFLPNLPSLIKCFVTKVAQLSFILFPPPCDASNPTISYYGLTVIFIGYPASYTYHLHNLERKHAEGFIACQV